MSHLNQLPDHEYLLAFQDGALEDLSEITIIDGTWQQFLPASVKLSNNYEHILVEQADTVRHRLTQAGIVPYDRAMWNISQAKLGFLAIQPLPPGIRLRGLDV